jgi:hypothetical protein
LDSRVNVPTVPTQQNKSSSLYGFDLLHYVREHAAHAHCAYDAAEYVLTHGGNYPIEPARNAIGLYDRAALDVLDAQRQLQVSATPGGDGCNLVMSVNTLGRLHIRRQSDVRPQYSETDRWIELGFVAMDAVIAAEIDAGLAALQAQEAQAFVQVRQAMDNVHAKGELGQVLGQVIDHVEHVESVCFYVKDQFFALIDRYVNLIDDKRNRGFLNLLRDKDYSNWSDDEVLMVAALHALFLSGRSVRFEEFNGVLLTARDLIGYFKELSDSYQAAGCEITVGENLDIFARAIEIRQQALSAVGKPWLRYRWIYGLNFQKIERILPTNQSNEPTNVCLQEFEEDYRELVSERRDYCMSEHIFMAQIASACLDRDIAGIPCERGSDAVNGWVEYLMEKIVASAVIATSSDYGMSSSLRKLSKLMTYDESTLVEAIHALTPNDFFTCFVSHNLIPRVGDEAKMIASTVQKRMLFNRWHFIPGNLKRELIRPTRHWYYPPMVPDISVHADMHRAAHNRARIKFSIRSPGPDSSRPGLMIGDQSYRGFYDVRVVRMDGEEYATEDILRTRRRTLWLETVYGVITSYLMSANAAAFDITGFEPGVYLDMPPEAGEANLPLTAMHHGELHPVSAAGLNA